MADWEVKLPGKVAEGDTGHVADHNTIVSAIKEARTNIDETPKGDPGADGLSAFEVAQSEGFEGTVTEWLAALKGDPGADGKDGAKGDTGPKGDDGADGFGTEKQYKDVISRLKDLEDAVVGGDDGGDDGDGGVEGQSAGVQSLDGWGDDPEAA